MAGSSELTELERWYEELQTIPPECHLLCPRMSSQDDENYKDLNDPESKISLEEKKQRIEDGKRRIEVTYWNSLIFGFDRQVAGKWLDQFTDRLESCLKHCPECVLSWHMTRRQHLNRFSENWNEETTSQIKHMLDQLDVRRIDTNLKFAKDYIEKIEATGAVFKRKQFGDNLLGVHVAIYEALCCMAYLEHPDQRTTFQYVFMRLQGKKPLKIGEKDPLPGMTFFLFDSKIEDRRMWARTNWKSLESDSVTENQFTWAIHDGLIMAINAICQKEASHAPDLVSEIEIFWTGVEEILRTLADDVVLSHIRSLEANVNIYDILLRHLTLPAESTLVVCIRVLSFFLKKAPTALWDFIGDGRPSVIPDLLFTNPVYHGILRQSLENCWDRFESGGRSSPFPTSWLEPWLQSLQRGQRYDACDQLLQPLFGRLAKDPNLGEPGQASCVRAGFDAMEYTLRSFLDPQTKIGTGTTQLYANSSFNLVIRYKDIILENLRGPSDNNEGWKTFRVDLAAQSLILAAMKLDIKLLTEEYSSLYDGQKTDPAISRDSKSLWQIAKEMFDMSTMQVALAGDVLSAVAPLLMVDTIRQKKGEKGLSEAANKFNRLLNQTEQELINLIGRFSDFDELDLTSLFQDRRAFEGIIAMSVRGEDELSGSATEVLKTWAGETSRSEAVEQISQLHPDATLGSMIWCIETALRSPWPWAPIQPLLSMSRTVLRGLTDPSKGVLRTRVLDPKAAATLLRWWHWQWRFVSVCCKNIEPWSYFIPNAVMQEFCRDIMELAEALMAEDGLISSAASRGEDITKTMISVLKPAKDNFSGMEHMIRLKDRWLVEVTVRVLCKILKRLQENELEIPPSSKGLIIDACVLGPKGKYTRSTNLTDQERAELLRALGHEDDEVTIVPAPTTKDKSKKQSTIDAWSKSGPSASSSDRIATFPRTNKDDVLDLTPSASSPALRQLQTAKARAQAKAAVQAQTKPQITDASRAAFLANRKKAKAEQERRKEEMTARAKQIRGQAVSADGLDIAQEHSRSDIYINSSEEESESETESDVDDQLEAIAKVGQKSADEAEKQRRRILQDKMRRPVKKVRQQRSVKEMRARLQPPMDKLHKVILAWDIFHSGNEPPDNPGATEVATRYADPAGYQKTFFPLLVSEAWRSFVTSKDEVTGQPFGLKVASRASVNDFLEVAYSMPLVKHKDQGIFDGDILLVAESSQPLENPSARHCLARVQKHTYKKDTVEITFRVSSRSNPMHSILTPGSALYAMKITNMTPIEREYAALESVQYYDLMLEILSAQPSPVLNYGSEKVERWMQNWTLNRGQALAVLGAQDNDGFTLIQGPPGTGKTKTIIAMVGALLSDQLSTAASRPTGTMIGQAASGGGQKTAKKLLICAPSNAAVDELVLRLKAGVISIGGNRHRINVVRLGRSEAINEGVKDVTLEELVKKRLEGDKTVEKAKEDKEKLHQEAGRVKEDLNVLRPQLEEARGGENLTLFKSLSDQFDRLKSKQRQIGLQIDKDKEQNQQLRDAEVNRRRVQQEILNGAHILCATLSGSGHDMFRNLDVEFETVIIDEAAQCVELSALIPLKYGCCKCILVGDPKQLPPTVLSQSAARYGYDQSLFVRMQQNYPNSVHLLEMQYRMHPEISMFPSKEFYEGQLQDGQNMLALRQQPWHQSALLGPYRFFDVRGVQEKGSKGQSLVNTKELEVALQIYDRIKKEYQNVDLTGKIGIITPYKAQLNELRHRFRNRYGESIMSTIEFNTTDAFQGRECEIIIFSCVRASSTGGIGFMTDIRRMNVGLTRAKSSLWVLGDSRALVQGEFWKKLIDDARARDRYTEGDILSMFKRPLERAKIPSSLPTVKFQSDTRSLAGMEEQRRIDSDEQELALRARPRLEPMDKAPVSGVTIKVGSPPAIQSSRALPEESRKRAHEGPEPLKPPKKKVIHDKLRGGGLAGKFGQKIPKAPKAYRPPTDPSAMLTLGLVPPERPPPQSIPTELPADSQASGSLPSRPENQPPRPTRPPKKNKPSLFMPKKR